MDVAGFLRLQGAIRSVLDSVSEGQAAVAAEAMADSYRRLRHETRDAIPEEDREEFDRLFPETPPAITSRAMGRLGYEAAKFHAARALLGTMAGWLDGYVQHARMQMEAQAYAEKRAKEERGVGFKGST